REEARKLLDRVVTHLRESAVRRGDRATTLDLHGGVSDLVEEILRVRDRLAVGNPVESAVPAMTLESWNGITAGPVRPRPVFHGRDVPMNSGFVNTVDIGLWDGNARLDIHIG